MLIHVINFLWRSWHLSNDLHGRILIQLPIIHYSTALNRNGLLKFKIKLTFSGKVSNVCCTPVQNMCRWFLFQTGLSGNVIMLSVLYSGGMMMTDAQISVGDLTSFLLYAGFVGISFGGNIFKTASIHHFWVTLNGLLFQNESSCSPQSVLCLIQ